MFYANGYGVAQISQWMDGFSLYQYDRLAVFGRAIVVHVGAPRRGCGVIGGAFGVTSATVTAALYPGPAQAPGFAYPNAAAVASLPT